MSCWWRELFCISSVQNVLKFNENGGSWTNTLLVPKWLRTITSDSDRANVEKVDMLAAPVNS